jgi:hypothetical protein
MNKTRLARFWPALLVVALGLIVMVPTHAASSTLSRGSLDSSLPIYGRIPAGQSADEDSFVYLPLILRRWPTPLAMPEDPLVYYGWPSCINGTWDIGAAAAEFGRYDHVVLGDCLEFDGTVPGGLCNSGDYDTPFKHGDHDNTKAIIAHPAAANTSFFGYIDLGVSTQNLPMPEVERRIRLWKATAVDGVFFDDFGYDFWTPRQRQNDAVSYAHSQGMVVVANGFDPDDVLGDQVDPVYNPTGTPTELNSDDYYFYESYQIKTGSHVSETEWQQKATKLDPYRSTIGIQVMATTTTDEGSTYDEDKFLYAWYSALLYGYEAVGWGEYEYAANTCQVPFRDRPVVDPGTWYMDYVVNSSPVYTRGTDLGRIWVDTSVPDAGFATD